MLKRPGSLEKLVTLTVASTPLPMTVKIRLGVSDSKINAHQVVEGLVNAGVAAVTGTFLCFLYSLLLLLFIFLVSLFFFLCVCLSGWVDERMVAVNMYIFSSFTIFFVSHFFLPLISPYFSVRCRLISFFPHSNVIGSTRSHYGTKIHKTSRLEYHIRYRTNSRGADNRQR